MKRALEVLCLFMVLLSAGLLPVNGGSTRTARSTAEVNCENLASSYSSFNFEELVTKGADGKPEKDGRVRTFLL